MHTLKIMNISEYIQNRIGEYGPVAITVALEVMVQKELYELAEITKQCIEKHNVIYGIDCPTAYNEGSLILLETNLYLKGYKQLHSMNHIPEYASIFLKNLAMVYDIDQLKSKHELIRECTEIFENPKELIIEP